MDIVMETDEQKTCVDCGMSWTYEAGEKEWIQSRGLSDPRRYRPCRRARRLQRIEEQRRSKTSKPLGESRYVRVVKVVVGRPIDHSDL
jgi:hypothetical protein